MSDTSSPLEHLQYASYEYSCDFLEQQAARPWLGHVAFAYVLMNELRPKILVELGTYCGVSLFAFCQAVSQMKLATHCYAVDSWDGDEQSGFYGNDIYDAVNSRVQSHYADFVTLKRMFFDEALADFADESIDVLHIDGLHTYEAVRHDFDTWLPKVRPGGIILMHDVNEYTDSYGAHRVWDEIVTLSDEVHLFRHSHGLGVWRKPGGAPLESALLTSLLRKNTPEATWVDAYTTVMAERDYYTKMSRHLGNVLSNTLNCLEGRVAEAHNQRAAEIEGLQQQIEAQLVENAARVQNYEQRIQQMVNSRSWRLTAPLRAIVRLFQK